MCCKCCVQIDAGIFFQTKWNEFLQQYSSGRDHFTLYVYGTLFSYILCLIVIAVVIYANLLSNVTNNCWGNLGSSQTITILCHFYPPPGSTLLTVGLYWAIGLIYLAMDVTNLPTFIRKYKTQPGQNEPVDIKRLLPVLN